MAFEVCYVLVHDEDTGKSIGKPIKTGSIFNTEAEIEHYREEKKKEFDNGHTTSVYFVIKHIPDEKQEQYKLDRNTGQD